MKEELIPFAYPKNNFDNIGNIIKFVPNIKIKSKVPNFEKNRGKLKDMYGFAFGVADRLIKNGGIISFITSNTYLSIPTYKWLRKYLLDNLKIEYIINFNKTGEKSNSMFEPESAISTCIIILQKICSSPSSIKLHSQVQ